MKKLIVFMTLLLTIRLIAAETPGVSFISGSGGGGTSLPDQTGHANDILTTNGTTGSWTSAPTVSGANITLISASNLSSGTIPDGRFPATLPAASGVNLTALNGSNVASGTVAAARGGTGVSNAGTFTNASNTTITGGGTIALGGFTLTAPATGSAALLGTANAFTKAQTIAPDSATNALKITEGGFPQSLIEFYRTNGTTLLGKIYSNGSDLIGLDFSASGSSGDGLILASNIKVDSSGSRLRLHGSTVDICDQTNTGGNGGRLCYFQPDSARQMFNSAASIVWTASADPSGADPDIGIKRGAAGELSINNSSTSDALRATAGGVIKANAVTAPTFSSGSCTSNVITINTTAAHNLATGQIVTISGSTGVSCNGSYPITVTSTTAFTFNKTVGNGNVTAATITPIAELQLGEAQLSAAGSTGENGVTRVSINATAADTTALMINAHGAGDSNPAFKIHYAGDAVGTDRLSYANTTLALGAATGAGGVTLGGTASIAANSSSITIVSGSACTTRISNSTSVNSNNGRVMQVENSTTSITGVLMSAQCGINWNATADFNSARDPDVGLVRNAAGVLRVSDSTTGIKGFLGGGAAVASASALPVPTGRVFHVTGTTNIDSITSTNFQAGCVITLIFDGVLTVGDANNLKLSAAMVTTADDTLTLVYDGTNWYECCRSAN